MLGLDWHYGRSEVSETELDGFLNKTQLDGFSVTMPLKETAFALSESVCETAARAGAVNTLVRTPSGWAGHNTDVFGLTQALRGAKSANALILGSGATARNAVLAVAKRFPAAVIGLKARNASKAEQLARWAQTLDINVRVILEHAELDSFDLVISTLPPKSDTAAWFRGTPTSTLLDVAYSPWPSELAQKWLASGGNVISGLEMLIWQAIGQLRIFRNGSVADSFDNEEELADAMRAAAKLES